MNQHTNKPEGSLHEDQEKLCTIEDKFPGFVALPKRPLVQDVENFACPWNGTEEYSSPKANIRPGYEEHSSDCPGNHFNEEHYDVENPKC